MQTILLVDDDPALRRNIQLALEQAGYHALCAANAEECMAKLADADLLLLDLMLPGTDGYALCRTIRSLTQKPVLFLSSCSDESDIVKGLDLGADDYITKPFRLGELLSRIRAALRRAQIMLPKQPELSLTVIEQKLLNCLMEHAGQYVTRTQLLEYLWDSKGCFVNDNTLSVHISRLRDKLRAAGAGQIQTKRGLGYQWIESTDCSETAVSGASS